jgi:hypothetical protein
MIIDPYEVAPDTFVIQSYEQPPGAPVGVHMNSMVTRGPEPVIYDTGISMDHDAWIELVDPARYARKVEELTSLGIEAIASTHGPAFTGAMVEQGLGLLRDVLVHDAGPEPGQPVLDEIVAQILGGAAPLPADAGV